MRTFRNNILLAMAILATATAFIPHNSMHFHHQIQSSSMASTPLYLSATDHKKVAVSENSLEDSSKYQQQLEKDDFKTNGRFAVVEEFVDKFLSAGGGEVGNRGELYFFIQSVLILSIVAGRVPFLGNLRLLAGPGLLLGGTVVLVMTAMDMGESITPWPKPNGQGLVQDGLYGQVRHPMYSGLLAVMFGFSIATGSVDRLLLTAVLWFAIDIKSNFEEEELTKAYPNYPEYQKKVTSKFIPKVLLDLTKGRPEAEKAKPHQDSS